MALKNIANSDLTISHGTGSIVTGGTFTVNSTPSTKVKANNKGVHKGGIAFSFSGGSAPGCNPGSVTGSGTIFPKATKVKAEGQLVNRVDDDTNISMTGKTINPAPPPPLIDVPLGTQPVVISNAGQNKVKGQ
ncbi:MAG: hypothetical protein ACFFG0_35670 [Candidatus Thorarchaeota archaeon]